MKAALLKAVQSWNGKDNHPLKDYYHDSNPEEFIQCILTAATESKEFHVQLSWLLKYHLENGGQLESKDREALILNFLPSEEWPVPLHIFQLVYRWTDLSAEEQNLVLQAAQKGRGSDNKFLRAWSYQAVFELSKFQKELKAELQFLAERAITEEAASVKVRLREILKALKKE